MDFLRRAFSLPQLFKDWDKNVKRKRSRQNAVLEVDPTLKNHYRRNCASRISKTWSRLVESRSTGKIYPVVEDDGDPQNRRLGKSQVLAKSCIEVRAKNSSRENIHVTSSSCDLAPTLLSIYDNYGSVTASVEINNCAASSDDLNSQKEPTSQLKDSGSIKQKNCYSSLQGRHTRQKSKSCQNVNWKSEELITVEINGNMEDTGDIQMKDVEDESLVDDRTTASCPGGVSSLKDNNAGATNATACTSTAVMDEDGGLGTCNPGHQEGCFLAPGVQRHQLSETDAKKRPLSISSTSSSVSSSSLPRHQRKKVATSVILSSSHHVNCDTRYETGKDQSESQNSNVVGGPVCSSPQRSNCSMVSGACNYKEPTSEGPVDSSPRTPCTSCRHSRMGFSDHNHICDITEVNEFNTSDTLDSPSQDLNRSLSDPGGGHIVPPKSPSVSSTHSSHRFVLDFGGSYLSKVVHEVLETERIYVADLRDIIQGYIGYLDSTCDLAIEVDEKKALFGNIGDIYNFNSDFLDHLEQCDLDPVQVAQCFVDRSEGFLIYTDYCTNYPRSMEVLTVIMRDKHLSDVFKRQQMNLHHALPLGSYLLKPVQRILKYHLFLLNMLNNFDKCGAGHESVIAKAFESMTNIAQHINEMKRQHERAVHIQEIQSMLFGWDKDDLTTYGELVLEDHFRVHGAKAHRLLYLFEKVLIIAKRKEDGNLLVKGSIKCSDLMLVESIPKEPLSFHVIPFSNPRMQFTVQAKNLDHKHQWCQEIKRLMIDNFQAVIPDKAKQLMMMLGKSKEEEEFDDKASEDTGSSKKQHTAPEYLERRRHRRKSTSIIPDFGLLKNRRQRRHNEEAGNSPSRPAGLAKGRDGGMFVSYVSQKPQQGHLVEEEEDIESEAPSSTRGSSKSSTLESKSLSLESLQDLTVSATQQPTLGPVVCPKSPVCPRDGPFFMDQKGGGMGSRGREEVGCLGAKRASRVGSEDLLLIEEIPATQKTKTDTVTTETRHIMHQSSGDTKEGSPLRRGESYRKAYELNRMDSVKLAHRRLSKDSDGGEDACEKQAGSADRVEEGRLDEGYVGVVFGDHGVTLPVVGESSTDSPDHVQITIPDPGESSTDPVEGTAFQDNELVSHLGAQVIANSHVDTTKKRFMPKGAISCANKHGALVVQNSMVGEIGTRECSSDARLKCVSSESQGYMLSHSFDSRTSPRIWNSPYSGNALQYSGLCDSTKIPESKTVDRTAPMEHVLANSYITSTPVTVNTCLNVHSSPLHTARSGGLTGSVYSVSNLASPVRLSSDMKNGMSQSKVEVCSPMDISDPWILRADALKPCNSANCRKKLLSQPVFRQHSMGAMDVRNRIKQKKRISKLYRSNSCASLDEESCATSDQCNTNKQHPRHKRVSSDTSTLVFANKSAFLSSERPHVIKYSPEIQRTVARLGTPPRDMGPEHLLEEIGECRSKGKVVMRYATPPREVMDPALLHEGTVFENNYTCALEKEILENLRQNVQDSSIEACDSRTRSSSKSSLGFLPHISKLLNSVSTPPSSPVISNIQEKSMCSNNKEMWEELQKHVGKSGSDTSSVAARSSITQSSTLLSPPLSRPGSFHGGASHISVTPLAHSTPGSHTPVSCSSSTVLTHDGIVDSLKNAVMSLTSKIKRRSPRSVEASPIRVAPRRARSLGAEEDARIRPTTKDGVVSMLQQKPPKSARDMNQDKKKEVKRNRFVYHLARAYSERIKKNRIDTDSMKGLPSSYMQTGSKLSVAAGIDVPPTGTSDIKTIGDRMAHSKPNILGTYTLKKHRYTKSKPLDTGMDIHIDSELESVESSSGEGGSTHQHDRSTKHCDLAAKPHPTMSAMPFLPSDAMDTNHGSESDGSEEPTSLDCFYERQFNDVLGQLEEGCRDSAIYSDDGAAINSLDSDFVLRSGKTNLVDKKSSGGKDDPKRRDNSQGVKDIVKNLEATSKGSKSTPISPVSEPIKPLARKHSNPLNSEDLRSVKMSPSSFQRHRTRELQQVALYSRIRQNSFDDLDKDEQSFIDCACECTNEPVVSGGSDSPPEEDPSKPRMGWVKQVVSQIQGTSVCS